MSFDWLTTCMKKKQKLTLSTSWFQILRPNLNLHSLNHMPPIIKMNITMFSVVLVLVNYKGIAKYKERGSVHPYICDSKFIIINLILVLSLHTLLKQLWKFDMNTFPFKRNSKPSQVKLMSLFIILVLSPPISFQSLFLSPPKGPAAIIFVYSLTVLLKSIFHMFIQNT